MPVTRRTIDYCLAITLSLVKVIIVNRPGAILFEMQKPCLASMVEYLERDADPIFAHPFTIRKMQRD
jgi:hypothetical protein